MKLSELKIGDEVEFLIGAGKPIFGQIYNIDDHYYYPIRVCIPGRLRLSRNYLFFQHKFGRIALTEILRIC